MSSRRRSPAERRTHDAKLGSGGVRVEPPAVRRPAGHRRGRDAARPRGGSRGAAPGRGSGARGRVRELLALGAGAVPDARRPRSDERGQPLSLAGPGHRRPRRRHPRHGPRSVVSQPRQDGRGQGGHAQAAGRVPARHAGGDRPRAQHERGKQPGLERPGPEAG